MISKGRFPLEICVWLQLSLFSLLDLGQVQNSKPAVLFSDLVERSETGYCWEAYGEAFGNLMSQSFVFFCVFVSVHTYDIQVLFKLFKCQIRSKISLVRRERIRVVVCVFVALTVSVSAGKRMLGCSVSLHDFAEWTEAYRQRCMCQCQATWTST